MTRLADLPAPTESTDPGYYTDPLGGRYPRYWDGSRWTARVGAEKKPPLQPGEHDLVQRRGRDPGELVKAALRLYRRYPALFLILAGGVLVPFDLIVLAATGAGPFTEADASVGAQIFLGLARWVLLGPLVSALHVHAVADVREGKEPEVGDVARRGLAVLPVVAAATIMSSLGVALGLVALIVPGIILFFRWFVVAQVAAIDNDGWLKALRVSRQLTADKYTHIFVFMLLMTVITGIPNLVLTAIFSDGETTLVSFPVGVAVQVLTTSFTALATAFMYFDLVARKSAEPGAA